MSDSLLVCTRRYIVATMQTPHNTTQSLVNCTYTLTHAKGFEFGSMMSDFMYERTNASFVFINRTTGWTLHTLALPNIYLQSYFYRQWLFSCAIFFRLSRSYFFRSHRIPSSEWDCQIQCKWLSATESSETNGCASWSRLLSNARLSANVLAWTNGIGRHKT